MDNTTVTYKHPKFNQLLGTDNAVVSVISNSWRAGDIKFNSLQAWLYLHVANSSVQGAPLRCEISPFTHNCGIKSLSYIQISSSIDAKAGLDLIESFLRHQCNVGYVVASDFIDYDSDVQTVKYTGPSLRILRQGEGYIETPPVWNPNYVRYRGHLIVVVYKDLNQKTYENYWKEHNHPELFEGYPFDE